MTGPVGPAPAVITLREVYDLVTEVRDSVAIVPSMSDQIKDHETRIRSLERKVWIVAGAAAVIGGVLGKVGPALFQ
ncbi:MULTISPECIES: hypothetical protein [Bacteria]|uniref:DUF7201 family protein n=1 Tax=Bacteria TaxID=2 RepID=UPI003C7CB588